MLTPASPAQPSRALLSPEERIAEALFGLIMVITFTGSLSIAEAGHEDVRAMLIGALGCNIAWGIIDGVLYLMGSSAASAHQLRAFRALRESKDPATAEALIRDSFPVLASCLTTQNFEQIRQRAAELPEPPRSAGLTRKDWLASLAIFLWVFAVTFPVTLPFMLMGEVGPAMRVSNTIAVALLAVLGFAHGRIIGRNPWLYAVGMIILGGVLVGLTIALGG